MRTVRFEDGDVKNSLKRFKRRYLWYTVCSNGDFQNGIFFIYLFEKGFFTQEVSLLKSIFLFCNLLTEVPIGLIADKRSRKFSIIIGLILLVANGIGFIIFDDYLVFAVLFVFQGLAVSLLSGSDDALLYDNLRALNGTDEYVAVQSNVTTVSALSLAAATWMGGIFSGYSWNLVYMAYIGSMFLAICTMFSIPEERIWKRGHPAAKNSAKDDAAAGLAQYLRTDPGKHLVSVILAAGLIEATVYACFYLGQSIFSSFGYDSKDVGYTMAAAELIAASGYFVSQFIWTRTSFRNIVYVIAISIALLFFVLDSNHHFLTLCIFQAAMFLGAISRIVFENYIQMHTLSEYRASVLSCMTWITSLLTACVFLVVSMVESAHIAAVMQYFSILPLMAGALMMWRFSAGGTNPE